MRYSTSIYNFSIATATGASLSRDEVNDALVYASSMKTGKNQTHDNELNAAYSAYRFGLCDSYANPYQREEDDNSFSEGDDVLQLVISSQALAADTAAHLLFADNTYATMDFFGWCLGRNNPSRKRKDGDYWNNVKRWLSETIAAAR